jgi:hypothetical protein
MHSTLPQCNKFLRHKIWRFRFHTDSKLSLGLRGIVQTFTGLDEVRSGKAKAAPAFLRTGKKTIMQGCSFDSIPGHIAGLHFLSVFSKVLRSLSQCECFCGFWVAKHMFLWETTQDILILDSFWFPLPRIGSMVARPGSGRSAPVLNH